VVPAWLQQFCNVRRQGWSSRNDHLEVAMNTIRRIHRLAGLLAASAAALLVLAAASPAMASTALIPYYERSAPPAQTLIHTMTAGGMPGWQITLIAVAAAALSAILAVAADRARATRRHIAVPSA